MNKPFIVECIKSVFLSPMGIRVFTAGSRYNVYQKGSLLATIDDTVEEHFIGGADAVFLKEHFRQVETSPMEINDDTQADPAEIKHTLKQRFILAACTTPAPKLLVTVGTLPSGALEVITNTEYLEEKVEYLLRTYDDDFKLKANPVIQIKEFILL